MPHRGPLVKPGRHGKCRTCGADFAQPGWGSSPFTGSNVYCSRKCAVVWYRNEAARRLALQANLCRGCCTPIDKYQRHCASCRHNLDESRRQAVIARRNAPRACAVCSSEFAPPPRGTLPWPSARKTCSLVCADRYRKAQAIAWRHGIEIEEALVRVAIAAVGRHPKINDRECARCGKPFKADRPATRYCSNACAVRKYDDPQTAYREASKAAKARARQRLRDQGLTCRGTPIVRPHRPRGSYRPPRLPKGWRPCSTCGVYHAGRRAACTLCWYGRRATTRAGNYRKEGAPGSPARAAWNAKRNAVRRARRRDMKIGGGAANTKAPHGVER